MGFEWDEVHNLDDHSGGFGSSHVGAKGEEEFASFNGSPASVDETIALREFSKPLLAVFGLSALLKRHTGKIGQ